MSILDRDLNECQTFGEISEWRRAKYEIDKKSVDNSRWYAIMQYV
mgnify:CR=1 FL=1